MPKKKKVTLKKVAKKVVKKTARSSSVTKTKTTNKETAALGLPIQTSKASQPSAGAQPKPAAPAQEVVQGVFLGEVEDYFGHVQAAAVTLKADLAVGDTVRIKGHTTDVVQKVESLQTDHQVVAVAKSGDGVGIRLNERCRKGDRVYKI